MKHENASIIIFSHSSYSLVQPGGSIGFLVLTTKKNVINTESLLWNLTLHSSAKTNMRVLI